MTHAFFKGLLFLAAGSVIHAIGGEQDMRKMGGLRDHIPATFWTMTAATFAIAGFPPFAGFFSKDEILWRASQVSLAYWGIGVFTAFLTSFYMFRLWFLTFFGEYRGDQGATQAHGGVHATGSRAGVPAPHGHGGIHESPKIMLLPLAILAILSVMGGWIGAHRFELFLSPVFDSHQTARLVALTSEQAGQITAMEHLEWVFTAVSVAAAVLGLYLAWLLYRGRPQLPQRIADALGGFYHAVANKYYVDELYAILFVKPVVDGSTRILWHAVDQGVIDNSLNDSADAARDVSGNLRSYAGWVALGAAGVIAYMIWMGTR